MRVSRLWVETSGRTFSRTMARASATMRPASRILRSSSSFLSQIKEDSDPERPRQSYSDGRDGLLLGPAPSLRPLPAPHESLVLPHEELGLDLVDEVESDTDDNEDSRAPEELGDVGVDLEGSGHDLGEERDAGEECRPGERDPLDDLLEMLGGVLPGPYARDEAPVLLHLARDLHRVEHERRPEVG